jgi:hypothetical protein
VHPVERRRQPDILDTIELIDAMGTMTAKPRMLPNRTQCHIANDLSSVTTAKLPRCSALTAARSLRSLYLLALILRQYWKPESYQSPLSAVGLSLRGGFFFIMGAVNQAWLMIHSCAPFLEENLPK